MPDEQREAEVNPAWGQHAASPGALRRFVAAPAHATWSESACDWRERFL